MKERIRRRHIHFFFPTKTDIMADNILRFRQPCLKVGKPVKKQLKHILPVILTFVTVMLSAVCVNEKTLTNMPQVLTLYPKSSKIYNENRRMYAPANETILNTNLYYGNKATSIKAKKSSYVSAVYYNNYALALTQDKLYTSAYLKAKKAGTTTITYKIGKQKYSQKSLSKSTLIHLNH